MDKEKERIKQEIRENEDWNEWVGYLRDDYPANYEICNDANELFNNPKVVATGDLAYKLLREAKGENGSKIRKLFDDEKYRLPLSKGGLEFIQKIGLEYIKKHLNGVNVKEFRLLLRAIDKLGQINYLEIMEKEKNGIEEFTECKWCGKVKDCKYHYREAICKECYGEE